MAGTAPSIQPVAHVPQRLRPEAKVGICVPPGAIKRTHARVELKNGRSHKLVVVV